MNLFSLNRDGLCIELRGSLLNVYYNNNFARFKAEKLKLVKESKVSYQFVARDNTELYIEKDFFSGIRFYNGTIDFYAKITEKEKNDLLDFFNEILKE